jgi:hypothetical protein
MSKSKKGKKKNSGKKPLKYEKLLLATAILNFIKTLIELIRELTK